MFYLCIRNKSYNEEMKSDRSMRRISMMIVVCCCMLCAKATAANTVRFGKGTLTVTYVARNAVRVQYAEGGVKNELPDWVYVSHKEEQHADITVDIDTLRQVLTVKNRAGRTVFTATSHQLRQQEATLAFDSPRNEYLYGLGQFQDGYMNIRGLSRRLTQVNTQISIPMLLSSKGYGVFGTTTD